MKKDRYELLRKNVQTVELASLTGQTWLDSYGSLVPWSGSNHSGSVYKCGKNSFGLSGYASGVLESFKKDLEGVATIEVIDIRSK
jgi:hypothetical protein